MLTDSIPRRLVFALAAAVVAVLVVADPFDSSSSSAPPASGIDSTAQTEAHRPALPTSTEPPPIAAATPTEAASEASPPSRQPKPPKPPADRNQVGVVATPAAQFAVLGTKCLAPGIRAQTSAGGWVTCGETSGDVLRWTKERKGEAR